MLKYNPDTMEWEDTNENSSLKQIEKRQQKINKPKVKPKKSVEEIYADIMQHEKYGYVYRLHLYVMSSMKWSEKRPVFRNMRGADHCNGTIKYGYDCINNLWEHGWEYVTVRKVWTRNGYDWRAGGREGLWALVLHEIAHYYDRMINNNFEKAHHGKRYQQCLNDLIEMFPFNECQNI